jgi:hypothetical protein
VTDLRDTIHNAAPHRTPEQTVFLTYHDHSPWAQAKVAAGLRLAPDAMDYMRHAIAERGRAKTERETILAAMKAEDEKPETETVPAAPVADRDTRAADVCGAEQP